MNKKHPGDGGNCGVLALAIARHITGADIVVCSNFDDFEDIRDYVDLDSDIYHVCLMYNNKLYDCTGEITIDDLDDIALNQYGDSYTSILRWDYEQKDDKDWSFVFRNQTNCDVDPEYYEQYI